MVGTDYIAPLKDESGNKIYPQILASAIQDAGDKLVTNGGEQLVIKGIKNFSDGLKTGGKDVASLEDLKKVAKIADLYDVTTTGFYYYDSSTKNIPFMQSDLVTGFFLAVFNNTNNGGAYFLGSGLYMEKFNSVWLAPKGYEPVRLWAGNAKVGDKLTLDDKAANYRQLRVTVKNSNTQMPVLVNTDSGSYYLTTTGLTGSGKGIIIDESHLTLGTDGKVLSYVSRKILNTESNTTVNSTDPCITLIEGIK